MKPVSNPRALDSSRPLLVLLLLLLLTVVASSIIAQLTREQQRVRFLREVAAHNSALQTRISDFDKLLQATRAFWVANPTDVTPGTFNKFSETLNLQERYPEVQALGFDAWIPSGQESTLETLMSSFGVQDFAVRPANSTQPNRAPIVLIAPLNPTNEMARGFDMMSEPNRRDALLRASNTGRFQATRPIQLVQQDAQQRRYTGFLLVLPVWQDETEVREAAPLPEQNQSEQAEAPAARQLSGFIYLAVRTQSFADALDRAYGVEGIQEEISLDGQPIGRRLAGLFAFQVTNQANLGGLTWQVRYAAPASFGRDTFGMVPFMTFLLGLGISVAAYSLMRSQARARQRAEAANINLYIAQRKQERARAEFEAIFQSMQDAAAFTDSAGRIRMVNRALSKQFGYERGDLEGQPLTELHLDLHLSSQPFDSLTTPYRRRDGSEFQGETQRTTVQGTGGEVLGVLEVVRDVTERVQAQRALQEAEQRSRAVLDTMPHIVWVSSAAGQVTYINEQHRRRLGTWSVRESVHTEDLTVYDAMWQGAYARQARGRCEVRLRVQQKDQKGAAARWYDVRVMPLLNRKGEAAEWVASATDIHDRMVAERLAQRNEMRYRGVLEGMPQIVWLADKAGQMTYFNQRWERYIGEERAQSEQGRDLVGNIHPDDRAEYQLRWQAALEQGTDFEDEHRLLGKDGRYCHYVTRGLPVHDQTGKVIEWVGTSTDVDSSVYAENAAKLLSTISDELSRRVYDPLAVRSRKYQAVMDLLTQNLVASAALWDTPSKDLVAWVENTEQWHLPHMVAQANEWIEQVMQTEATLELSAHPLLHAVEVSSVIMTPLIGLDGTMLGVLGLGYRQELLDRDHELIFEIAKRLAEAMDNDALRTRAQATQAELVALNQSLEERVARRTAELEEANKELEAFSYSVSHDLRTPLRHIMGFGDMLRKDSGESLSPKSTRYLGVMTEAAGRMNTLIDSLLEFSRMGRAPLRLSPVNLHALVQQAWEHLETDRQGRQIDFVLRELPTVQGDANLLDLVFQNLLSNAVKYSRNKEHTRIEVWAESGQESVTVAVQDNGAGFDPKYTDKLFGVFQRLHRAEEFDGTGIGLANVRRIVVRHGGSVRAESVLGEGATFHVTLPLSPTAPSPSGEQ